MTFSEQLARLYELAREPVRDPMGREEQFPSMASQHIRNQEEKRVLREGLNEALGIIETLRGQLREPPRDGGDL